MTDGKTFRVYIRGEIAKLKAMSFKEKRQYIWEYYRIHIFVLVAVLAVVGSFLNHMLFNPPPRNFLYIAWLGPTMFGGELQELGERLTDIVENPEREIVFVNSYAIIPGQMVNPQVQERFAVLMQTAAIHVILISEAGVSELDDMGWIRPIHEVPGAPLSVNLYGSPLLAEVGICTQDLHFTVPGNMRFYYRIEAVLEKLFNGEMP